MIIFYWRFAMEYKRPIARIDYLHTDGSTDHLGTPVIHDMGNSICIIESWPKHVPSETHSLELHSVARLVHQSCAFHMQTFHLRNLLSA